MGRSNRVPWLISDTWLDTDLPGAAISRVTRLDPSRPSAGQLIDSTFVGGAGFDSAYALSTDASGVVTIAGYTGSLTYPTTRTRGSG